MLTVHLKTVILVITFPILLLFYTPSNSSLMLQVSRSKNPIQQKLNVENYSTFIFQKVKVFVAIVRFNSVQTSLC